MSIKKFSENMAEKSSISEFRSRIFLTKMYDEMALMLKRGEKICLRGIGTIEIADTPDTVRYDAHSKKKIRVKNTKRIRFTPSRTLKDNINKDRSIEYID